MRQTVAWFTVDYANKLAEMPTLSRFDREAPDFWRKIRHPDLWPETPDFPVFTHSCRFIRDHRVTYLAKSENDIRTAQIAPKYRLFCRMQWKGYRLSLALTLTQKEFSVRCVATRLTSGQILALNCCSPYWDQQRWRPDLSQQPVFWQVSTSGETSYDEVAGIRRTFWSSNSVVAAFDWM
jgi:hypothetical protein